MPTIPSQFCSAPPPTAERVDVDPPPMVEQVDVDPPPMVERADVKRNPSHRHKELEITMAMLTFDAYTTPTMGYRQNTARRTGLHRLFAAAVVSGQFREMLLRKPEEALSKGYLGQAFALTDHESSVIRSIRAENLTDFAQKVNQALKSA